MMDVILVPFSRRQPKMRHSRKPKNGRTQTEKAQPRRTTLCMFQELADKQEIIRYETWRDEKIDCSFVVPGTWYVSPSLISMVKTRQRWKTHMAAWRREQAHTKDAKHAPNSGSSSKHVAVRNYAEGSIVCFCRLLPQIIERFTDMVGGESCRLSFVPASSTFPLLCLHGASSFISPPGTLSTLPLVTKQ